MRRAYLMVAGVILGSLALIAGLAFLGSRTPRGKPIADVTTACIQHAGIGMHAHAHLKIVIDGDERKIPSDIGIVSARCFRPTHTHDDSGTLHLEFPGPQDVRLGEFFRVWGQPLSRAQVLDRAISQKDVLRVTVHDAEVNDLEHLLLHDRDDIVIEVRKKP